MATCPRLPDLNYPRERSIWVVVCIFVELHRRFLFVGCGARLRHLPHSTHVNKTKSPCSAGHSGLLRRSPRLYSQHSLSCPALPRCLPPSCRPPFRRGRRSKGREWAATQRGSANLIPPRLAVVRTFVLRFSLTGTWFVPPHCKRKHNLVRILEPRLNAPCSFQYDSSLRRSPLPALCRPPQGSESLCRSSHPSTGQHESSSHGRHADPWRERSGRPCPVLIGFLLTVCRG